MKCQNEGIYSSFCTHKKSYSCSNYLTALINRAKYILNNPFETSKCFNNFNNSILYNTEPTAFKEGSCMISKESTININKFGGYLLLRDYGALLKLSLFHSVDCHTFIL